MSTDDRAEPTPYERFGGHDFFVDLVADFYRQVADDPVLRPLYPEEDLGPAEVRLRMFFEQYWGGRRPTPMSAATRGYDFATARSPLTNKRATFGWHTCEPHWTTAIFRQTLMTKCGATS